MSPEPGTIPGLRGAPLRDPDGIELGVIEDLLVHAPTNRPAWFLVRLADGRRTVVPAAGARAGTRGHRAAFAAELVWDCPVEVACTVAARHYGLRPSSGGFVGLFAPDPGAAVASAGAPVAGAPVAVAA